MIDIRGTTWLDLHAAYIFERRTDTYLVDRYYLVCIVGTGVCSSLIFGKRFWTVSDEAVPSRVATWTLWTIADITLLTALVPLQVLPELAAHFLFFSRKKNVSSRLQDAIPPQLLPRWYQIGKRPINRVFWPLARR